MKTKQGKLKKPKCPRSPYMYFVKDYQQQLKKQNRKISFGEASKLCAAKWKHLPEEAKQKYKKMAEADIQRYKKEIQKFTPKQLKMLRRKKRDPRAPVRPLSAYMWFCKQNWKKVASNSNSYKDAMKELGRLWSECKPEVREKFEAMAECDKKCYEVEMGRYKAKFLKRKRLLK